MTVLLCACGSGTTHPPPAVAPVKLTVSSPADQTRIDSSSTTISGTVSPRTARVLVVGRLVKPDADGGFSAEVALVPGANLIDVIASARHARPAMTSLRITRYVLVSVPDVTGESPKDAAAAIHSAGLTPQIHSSGNPFGFLIPLRDQVCGQSPAGNAHVAPGSTVILDIGKVC
jgi:glucodextranase-like protein/PASTA domain-containing protein